MNEIEINKILFIYNANSGLRNMILDGAHKIINPSTYECNLCDITYGAFTENKNWKKYRRDSTVQMEFLHKDEFQKQYSSKFGYHFSFPIILAVTVNGLEVLVSSEEIDNVEKAGGLIALLNERI